MNLSTLPREVLERYIQTKIDLDERTLKLLHLDYKRELLHREVDRLLEEAEKVRSNIDAWNKVQVCINDAFEEMSKLGRSYDALIK